MVVQDRLALEVKDLLDEQANLVAAYVKKLKKKTWRKMKRIILFLAKQIRTLVKF